MVKRMVIHCVTKSDRYSNPEERILSIGGVRRGRRWTMLQEDAIDSIQNGSCSFLINKDGRRIEVIVARSKTGQKYLKTILDREQPHTLLNLPECPL